MLLVVMLLAMTVNVMAAGIEFVPSIENKGAPAIVVIGETEDGKPIIGYIVDKDNAVLSTEHDDCIIITAIGDAETSKDIPEESKKILLDVYKKLKENGADAIPGVSSDKVVRDLFDLSSECGDIKTYLVGDSNTLDLKFDLKITKDTAVEAMIFVNGEWKKVPTKNNGDGTVTASFNELGAVAFLVDSASIGTSPDTGDVFGNSITLWVGIMAASVVLIVVLVTVLRRQNKTVR